MASAALLRMQELGAARPRVEGLAPHAVRAEFQIANAQWLRADDEEDENVLVGNANGIGYMDSYNSVIAPGGFNGVLDSFVKRGFLAVGHDWYSMPVGYFTDAKEEGGYLKVTARFHSTEEAQAARTVALERMAAKKFVGLSVGFAPDYELCKRFESGADMIKYLQSDEWPIGTSGFNLASIRACKSYCRLYPVISDLFEVSLVTVPGNKISGVTDVRSAAPSAAPDGGEPMNAVIERLRARLPFAEHLQAVQAVVGDFVPRAQDLVSTRADEARSLSGERKAALKELGEQLIALAEFELPATDADGAALALARSRMRFSASLAGVSI